MDGKIRYPGIFNLSLINWNRVAMGRHGLFVASVAGRTSKSFPWLVISPGEVVESQKDE
jgi:hypothetical protein